MYEALAAEEATGELLLEVDARESYSARGTEERVLSGHISGPPRWRRSIGRIVPGQGAANATRCLPAPALV